MGAAGALTSAELAPFSFDQLPIVAAQRARAADDELARLFGVRMRVFSPYGGYRTCSQQRTVNPAVSCQGSEHTTGAGRAAMDIDNHRWFRDRNQALFVATLSKWGIWFHVAGEPWHATISLTALAGGPTIPSPTPDPVAIWRLIRLADIMHFRLLGNIDTGAIAFLILGGEAYQFPDPKAFDDFKQTWNLLNTMCDPSQRLPDIPEATHQTIAFVDGAKYNTTIRTVGIG